MTEIFLNWSEGRPIPLQDAAEIEEAWGNKHFFHFGALDFALLLSLSSPLSPSLSLLSSPPLTISFVPSPYNPFLAFYTPTFFFFSLSLSLSLSLFHLFSSPLHVIFIPTFLYSPSHSHSTFTLFCFSLTSPNNIQTTTIYRLRHW